MKWAAQQGLILPVEVRWVNEMGLYCPDARLPSEDVLSNQYVVMLALAAKSQLSFADVEWNSGEGPSHVEGSHQPRKRCRRLPIERLRKDGHASPEPGAHV
jgi:hypothetical protein